MDCGPLLARLVTRGSTAEGAVGAQVWRASACFGLGFARRTLKIGGVNADDLAPEQAGIVSRAPYPGVNFLVRLKTRMEKAGLPGGG